MNKQQQRRGLGVYVMSEAEQRAEWTGETIEQAQAAIDAERATKPVHPYNKPFGSVSHALSSTYDD